jgi:hypothetical protein
MLKSFVRKNDHGGACPLLPALAQPYRDDVPFSPRHTSNRATPYFGTGDMFNLSCLLSTIETMLY